MGRLRTERDTDVAAHSAAFDDLLAEIAKTSTPNTLPNETMVGEYRVVKLLGRGAFGAVYHATHAVIGKQVAIKVLAARFAEDAAMAARFIDEARAVNRIAHPNIVDIFGFGALPDGRKYCVMELLNGSTLGERIDRSGPPSFDEALQILSQIAAALDAAHQSGVVHRDLKPDNIFLCESASSGNAASGTVKVKLLDFGIAQMADGLHQRTGSNVVLGTPAYMSPEQCRGARIDHRSDIYALGVVAFELFTGVRPFQGENAFQLAAQHSTAEPPPPSRYRPGLPREVDQAVLEMLAKRSEDRPRSADEAVRRLLSTSPLETHGGVTPSSRPTVPGVGLDAGGNQRWALRFGAPAVVVTAVALLGWQSLRSGREPHSAPSALGSSLGSASAAPSAARSVPEAPSSAVNPPSETNASVALQIDGTPASAKLYSGKVEVGHVGMPLVVPRSESAMKLTIRAPGFVSREIQIVPSQNRSVRVQLERASASVSPDLEY